MAKQTLSYILEGQAQLGVDAGPLGINRPRYWQVENDVLILTTRDAEGHPLSIARWKKEP